MSEEEFDFVRRLLIITVGSSASIHLLGGVARVYPDVLFRNKIMIIETSKKMFNDAIDYLAKIYHINYAKRKGKKPEEQKQGFPTSTFKGELIRNSVLLAEGGGGATPEKGLGFYNNKKEKVLEKIVNIVSGEESGGRELSGILVIGAAGKGTGTLVTPALLRDLYQTEGVPKPLGFMTLPFRFDEASINNAKKIMDVLHEIPIFLLDYERVIGSYIYMTGNVPEKDIPITQLYRMVVEALSVTLSSLIEALNFSTECNPPLDYSDIMPILKKGDVGTITYSVRAKRDDFFKKWKDDVSTLLLLRTKNRPKSTRAVTILKGVDIPLGITRDVAKFYKKYFNATPQQYILNRGSGYSIVSLIHGFDPNDIDPPLSSEKSLVAKLIGL